MKAINKYISEKLVINNNTGKIRFMYFPKTNNELIKLIQKRIKKEGNNCDLNDIDISKITDMSHVFAYSTFNGDISQWDMSNVEDMNNMFYESNFNGDISNWDVSNVEDMSLMFAQSKFNQDISKWDVSTSYIAGIFANTPLKGKEEEWWNK